MPCVKKLAAGKVNNPYYRVAGYFHEKGHPSGGLVLQNLPLKSPATAPAPASAIAPATAITIATAIAIAE
jgi:hypothetical protein